MKYYTGIGSRSAPYSIRFEMQACAHHLDKLGFTLRSGKAEGADQAFQLGAQQLGINQAEIYLPWRGFNRYSNPKLWDVSNIYPFPEECFAIAESVHPAWANCKPSVRRLHARNVCQVLGKDLKTPSEFVLYWAEEGESGEPKGGTRTAVVLARQHNIPTINMLHDNWRVKLREVVDKCK
jgi:hypothetical protein